MDNSTYEKYMFNSIMKAVAVYARLMNITPCDVTKLIRNYIKEHNTTDEIFEEVKKCKDC